MSRYLADGILQELAPGFVLLDRQTAHVPSRKGLMVALDLEHYDYLPGAQTLIRATEGTILDRLPPRIRVREKAPIELPHIMVLIDDPERTVIEPLFEQQLPLLYDFRADAERRSPARLARSTSRRLIDQIGRALAGWPIRSVSGSATAATGSCSTPWATATTASPPPRRSGNSSRPRRRTVPPSWTIRPATPWSNWSTSTIRGWNSRRFTACFSTVDADDLLACARAHFAAAGTPCRIDWLADLAAAEAAQAAAPAESHAIPFIAGGRYGLLTVLRPHLTLAVATLQEFLDAYLAAERSRRTSTTSTAAPRCERLGAQPDAVGFLLPALSKHELFRTIVHDGALARKTFSMGEADEKRFYLECRRIA